ncbi:unnamed protein product [Leptosia nina]|uniref:Uncharacterized protein n=1 Tax=Leptosia nina TaxID=320188 RepID=A0AAV1J8K8_9NEOP
MALPGPSRLLWLSCARAHPSPSTLPLLCSLRAALQCGAALRHAAVASTPRYSRRDSTAAYSPTFGMKA